MTSRAELIARLQQPGPFEKQPDNTHSVSGAVLRFLLDGQRAVAVGSDASAHNQICALLDVLSLHWAGAKVHGVQPSDDSAVVVVIGRDPGNPGHADEALDALRTLRSYQTDLPDVRIMVWEGEKAAFQAVHGDAPSYATSAKAADYRRLLDALAPAAPKVLRDLVDGLTVPGLRAYPMLTQNPFWSLRLEGLEVGRFRDHKPDSYLAVGRDGSQGASSAPRGVWLQTLADCDWFVSSKHTARVLLHDVGAEAARALLAQFAGNWHASTSAALQNEHALESRILRGDCPVTLGSGRTLQLLQPDPLINWGSQFPTRWGTTSGSARYLDALLHDGATPYAVEMKVEQSVGQYYRHAIAQAVLYRHFIRSADPLRGWFQARDLEPHDCEAIVVVPAPVSVSAQQWVPLHRDLAKKFGIELCEVPADKAIAHG